MQLVPQIAVVPGEEVVGELVVVLLGVDVVVVGVVGVEGVDVVDVDGVKVVAVVGVTVVVGLKVVVGIRVVVGLSVVVGVVGVVGVEGVPGPTGKAVGQSTLFLNGPAPLASGKSNAICRFCGSNRGEFPSHVEIPTTAQMRTPSGVYGYVRVW
jgi:hypothetical protein